MFLIQFQFLLFHSRVFIFLEKFSMPVYDVRNRIMTHIYDALRWPYSGVLRFTLHSHHASLVSSSLIRLKPKIGGRTSM